MLLDRLYVLGVNYEDLTLVQREKIVKRGMRGILNSLKEKKVIEGFVLLETCLRVEFYLETKNIKEVEDYLNIPKYSVKYSGLECVRYLFEVACGYHSIIKGEDHILSQVRTSFLKDMDLEQTTSNLNVIFNKSIEVGKKFRHESGISRNALSLEAIALKFIKSHLPDLDKHRIFIVGTGEMAVSVLNIFTRNNLGRIVMTNRSKKRAIALKKDYDIEVVDFLDRYREIEKADVIISATAAHHTILRKSEMINLGENGAKIFLDLGLPRDIDESIGTIEGIELYNLDHLWEVYNENAANRTQLLEEYNHLIQEQLGKVVKHFKFKEEGCG